MGKQDVSNRNRVQPGTQDSAGRKGGQFAPETSGRNAPNTKPAVPTQASAKTEPKRVYCDKPDLNTRKGTLRIAGIASSKQESSVPGASIMSIGSSNAGSGYVDSVWKTLQEQKHFTPLDTLDDQEKVLVLTKGTNMFGAPVITAQEGTIRMVGDQPALLPKGNSRNGFYLTSRHKVISGMTAKELASDPAVTNQPVTYEASEEELSKATSKRPVFLYGTYRIMGESVPGSVYVVQKYSKKSDIVEGFLYVPPGSGFTSEHGSVYGQELLRQQMGVVEGPYSAPASLADWYKISGKDASDVRNMFVR